MLDFEKGTISSRKNTLVGECRRTLRGETEYFAAESAKIAAEAVSAGFVPAYALVTEKAAQKYTETVLLLSGLCTVTLISDELGGYVSDTKTPQGVFAVFPRKYAAADDTDLGDRCLILDGVNDPGNAGAIVRSAEAFGFGTIFFVNGGCDPYSPKAVRGAAGSLFRARLRKCSAVSAADLLKRAGFEIYAAVPPNTEACVKTAEIIREVPFPAKTAVVIGNEANGVSEEMRRLCDKEIYIPINGAESLNAAAAAAVICYEIAR